MEKPDKTWFSQRNHTPGIRFDHTRVPDRQFSNGLCLPCRCSRTDWSGKPQATTIRNAELQTVVK